MIWPGVKLELTLSMSPAMPATAGALVELPHASIMPYPAQMPIWQPGAARPTHGPRVENEANASLGSVLATAKAPGSDAGCVSPVPPVFPADASTSTPR